MCCFTTLNGVFSGLATSCECHGARPKQLLAVNCQAQVTMFGQIFEAGGLAYISRFRGAEQ